ncbi:hypothetical protein IWW50_003710 [Coemansia erecta]|nr:hypothetical protein IWW50_003710 [Coemansia erecta]
MAKDKENDPADAKHKQEGDADADTNLSQGLENLKVTSPQDATAKRMTLRSDTKAKHNLADEKKKQDKLRQDYNRRVTLNAPSVSAHGTDGALGKSAQQCREDQRQYARDIYSEYAIEDVEQIWQVCVPDPELADKVADEIAAKLEGLLEEKQKPGGAGQAKRGRKGAGQAASKAKGTPHASPSGDEPPPSDDALVNSIFSWSQIRANVPTEKPLYEWFAHFALFVARELEARKGAGYVKRLVLPAKRYDFNPSNSTDSNRIDAALAVRDVDKAAKVDSQIDAVKGRAYADMLCVVEMKRGQNEHTEAHAQILDYSRNILLTQLNRRFLWGLAACAAQIKACVVMHDGILVSPPISVGKRTGRKQLISLLVRYSMCAGDHLGYDPTMKRIEDSVVEPNLSIATLMDKFTYEITCYDDADGDGDKIMDKKDRTAHTYITQRTLAGAYSIIGRHTRVILAYQEDNKDDLVVIKDAWSPATMPLDQDTRNEINMLRTVHKKLAKIDSQLDHLYPELVVGGHVMFQRGGNVVEDTTDEILGPFGLKREGKLEHLHFRAHRRLIMTPYGQHISTVKNEEELIIVLAEAMRCHTSLHEVCHILHRDVSTNNILVVRNEGTGEVRGLLIDLDFAVMVDDKDRTARPARSGTLPFMSIPNILNMDTRRTTLDDWESLLYVLCWLGTFGICVDDRKDMPNANKLPISRWSRGSIDEIADEKRSHMDTPKTFSRIRGSFMGRYKLLPGLAQNLHKALFCHEGCAGAQIEDQPFVDALDWIMASDEEDMAAEPQTAPKPTDSDSDSDSSSSSSSSLDPLVKRNKFVDPIQKNLMKVMAKYVKVAEKRLKKAEEEKA